MGEKGWDSEKGHFFDFHPESNTSKTDFKLYFRSLRKMPTFCQDSLF